MQYIIAKAQFWRQDNHPIEVYCLEFITQKLNYIHDNPVRAGIVNLAEEYRYSGAKNYNRLNGLLDVLYI
jgi:putative transposase